MKEFFSKLAGFLGSLVCLAFLVWLMWGCLRRSDDPARLISKWVLTFVVIILCAVTTAKIGRSPILPGVAGVFGILLTIIWGSSVGELLARPFTSMFDGGSAEAEPVPLYSIAEAKRKQGKYEEAIAEVLKQLERFPADFRCWMLLAEIQAENQRNVTGARETVDRLLAQPGHAPKNIAFALSRCADWELNLREDRVAAQGALERIIEILPDTEQAQMARQRVAHLASPEWLAERHDPHKLELKQFDNRIGLRTPPAEAAEAPPTEDLSQLASSYVRQLEASPDDNETREKLACLYAHHFERLDLAEQQLEQLIAAPHPPPRQVVHWLNVLADLQVKTTGDIERARDTLRRIGELFPGTSFAENALNRIAYLKLEARSQQKSQVVKLGSYEKNLGLK